MNYKWVLCDNKISALTDIMKGLVDLTQEEYRIVQLSDYEVDDLDGYTLRDLKDFVSNEDISLLKKVVDK